LRLLFLLPAFVVAAVIIIIISLHLLRLPNKMNFCQQFICHKIVLLAAAAFLSFIIIIKNDRNSFYHREQGESERERVGKIGRNRTDPIFFFFLWFSFFAFLSTYGDNETYPNRKFHSVELSMQPHQQQLVSFALPSKKQNLFDYFIMCRAQKSYEQQQQKKVCVHHV